MDQIKPVTYDKTSALFNYVKFQLFLSFLKLGQPYCDMKMYTQGTHVTLTALSPTPTQP